MKSASCWWQKPRRVSVIVDNPSWIVPHAKKLVELARAEGDEAIFIGGYDAVQEGDIAFYLGCIKISPREVLARNRRNLIVHESDLPQGRGFSPLTWQVLEGKSVVPVVLLEAADAVDAGAVIYREQLLFEGHELIDEMRFRLGELTVSLCRRFLAAETPPEGIPQSGRPTYYRRRYPKDSRLDPEKTIAEQFDLLRVVDNERYPAWFEIRGHRYSIKIEKLSREVG